MDRRSTSNVHCKAYLALGLTEISHECSGNQTALKITVGFGRKTVLVLVERSWGTNIGKVEEERGTESTPRERNRTDLTDFRILCFLGIGPMPKLEHEFSFLLCQPTYTLILYLVSCASSLITGRPFRLSFKEDLWWTMLSRKNTKPKLCCLGPVAWQLEISKDTNRHEIVFFQRCQRSWDIFIILRFNRLF